MFEMGVKMSGKTADFSNCTKFYFISLQTISDIDLIIFVLRILFYIANNIGLITLLLNHDAE